jgi:transglutaminase-like putative cysteine protease
MSSVAQPRAVPARAFARGTSAVQRYFEASLFLLVATGALSMVSTGKLDLLTTALVPVAIIFKALRLWRGRGPELSARTATGLVLAYFLFFPLDLWVLARARSEGAPNPTLYAALLSAIHLLLFATVVRLYSARTSRDHAFLAVLAVASMLASAILTVETGFLIALALFLVLAVSTFVALEIRRSGADAVTHALDPGTPLATQLNRALTATSLLVALSALVLGMAIFFLIPRFTTGYMSAFNLQPNMMTGFSDDMTLGTIGEIQQDQSVVMHVQIQGDPALGQDIHWRGIVLTNFDGKRWFTPQHIANEIPGSPDGVFSFNPPLFEAGESQNLRYTVLLEPMSSNAVFVAPRIQALRGNFQQDVSRAGPTFRHNYLLMDETGSIFNSERTGTKMRYEGASMLPKIAPNALRRASVAYPADINRTYLEVPALDPRIRQLAATITANASNPYDKAESIELYLKTHYAYTLDLRGDPGNDPLAYFLFERRAGHCEYFASAMAIMLRDVGVPSRYATGFLPGEFNDVGHDYIIRESDAHAWVEVYFPGYGWMTFDPTPGGDAKHPVGLTAHLAMYWDWFQLTWSEWIVNYDFAHQLRLGDNTQRATRDYGAHARQWYEQKQEQAMRRLLVLDKHIEGSRYTLPSLLVFLIALLFWLRGKALAGYAVSRWRLGARRGSGLTASLAVFEYQEMLKMLEKAGWKKTPAQTPREFAAAISATAIEIHVTRLTELYQAARFGSRPAPAEEATSLLRSIRELLRTPQTGRK